MNLRTLIRRSLRFHWRGHLGVLLGAAVGSAALIGALVVGDSVRGSLRQRALERLGNIEFVLAPPDRTFRDSLRFDLESAVRKLVPGPSNGPVPGAPVRSAWFDASATTALRLSGTVVRQDGTARANQIQVFSLGPGLDHFARMPGLTNLPRDGVLLNPALAAQLRVRQGDALVFRLHKPSALPRDAAIARHSDAAAALRLKVHAIAPAEELGNFSLVADQAPPMNAFVHMDTLQATLGLEGRANVLLVAPLVKTRPATPRPVFVEAVIEWFHRTLRKAGPGPRPDREDAVPADQALAALSMSLRELCELEDLELELRHLPVREGATSPQAETIELRTPRIFLDSAISTAALAPEQGDEAGRVVRQISPHRAEEAGFSVVPDGRVHHLPVVTNGSGVLTYLVNQFRAGGRSTPYSMVAAMDPPGRHGPLQDNEMLINQWLADDLQIGPGDEVSIVYFLPDSGAHLAEATNRFRVRGVVPMNGPWLDRELMPDFPGVAEAESTHDWDAGFPLVHRIREKDDEYWTQYRGTPKGFIALTAGQQMWSNRFGGLTAIRFPVPPKATATEHLESIRAKFKQNIDPAALGLRFEPVRAQALAAASQAQDFGGLFLGFSFFLILAALILMALLFQFGLEQRTAETGTLLALGFTPRQVRGLLLREGVLVAFVGGALGVLGGIGYAKGMLHLLATLWRDAVGGSALGFHVTGLTLAIGLLASVVVCAVTIWFVLRKQAKRPARELLAEGTGLGGGTTVAFSPLTPALSPLRGEGVAKDPAASSELHSRAGALRTSSHNDTDAHEDCPTPGGDLRAPSPLNGERAGVRGETGENRRIPPPRQPARWIAATAMLIAVALIGWALARGDGASPQVFFGAGSLLLVAGLAGVSVLLSALERRESGQKLTLAGLGLRGCTRRRTRSLASVALLACGSFLIVAVGANRLDAGRDAARRSSGTGGFALWGEATLPLVRDLNTTEGREFYGLDDTALRGVSVVPFRVRDGDEASCLNLNRAQKPRLLGVKPELLADRGAFTFAKVESGATAADGWKLLRPDTRAALLATNEVPAIGDAASIQWALGRKIGDILDYTDERGREFKVRLVAGVANSILQGNLIIDEAEFLRRFPGEAGHRMFLIDTPSNDPAVVEKASAELSRALQDAGLELTPAARRLAAFNAVQNTYLNTFQVLGGLGLLLGSAGLGVVVLRNVLERRGELGLLQAVGFRRRALRWLVLSEHGGLLALGLAVGVIAALAAVLPVLFAPGARVHALALGATLAGVLASGLLWTWLATRVAMRGELLKALRNE